MGVSEDICVYIAIRDRDKIMISRARSYVPEEICVYIAIRGLE